MKTCRVLAENHKNRWQEMDTKRQTSGDVMEIDKERKVFIIKARRKMIGSELKTDREEQSMRE